MINFLFIFKCFRLFFKKKLVYKKEKCQNQLLLLLLLFFNKKSHKHLKKKKKIYHTHFIKKILNKSPTTKGYLKKIYFS